MLFSDPLKVFSLHQLLFPHRKEKEMQKTSLPPPFSFPLEVVLVTYLYSVHDVGVYYRLWILHLHFP